MEYSTNQTCKISEPYDNPFWENEQEPRGKRNERERKILPSIMAILLKYRTLIKLYGKWAGMFVEPDLIQAIIIERLS